VTFLIGQHSLATVTRSSRRLGGGRIVILMAAEVMDANVAHLLIRDQQKTEEGEGRDQIT